MAPGFNAASQDAATGIQAKMRVPAHAVVKAMRKAEQIGQLMLFVIFWMMFK